MSTRNLGKSVAPALFPWRRVVLAALIAAGAVALAAVAGPVWVVRVGTIVGLAAGVVAAVLAVAGLRRHDGKIRAEFGAKIIDIEKAHTQQLSEQRQRDGEVADVLSTRLRQREKNNGQLRERLTQAEEVIGTQRRTLEVLHREGGQLRKELLAKDGVIAGLRQTLSTREEELAALLGDLDAAEVYAMPRRARAAERAADPETNELVDLAMAQTVSPKTADLRQQA